MRDRGRDSPGVQAQLAQTQLEVGRHRPGQLDVPEQLGLVGQQVGLAAVMVHVGRARVGHGHGDAAHADSLAHAHGDGQVGHGSDELVPAVVRLAAVEQQEVLAVVVVEEVQDQLGHDD